MHIYDAHVGVVSESVVRFSSGKYKDKIPSFAILIYDFDLLPVESCLSWKKFGLTCC